jgi:GNAT superfamily N-acetyltransferase
MLTTRLATPQDGTDLFRLAREFATSFVVEEQAFRDALSILLADPGGHLIVATDDDIIVGYLLGFDHVTFFAGGRVSWVEEIMVRQDRRKEGIGRRLMEAFEAWSRTRGSKLVALATRRAAPFYEAIGYERSADYFRKLL